MKPVKAFALWVWAVCAFSRSFSQEIPLSFPEQKIIESRVTAHKEFELDNGKKILLSITRYDEKGRPETLDFYQDQSLVKSISWERKPDNSLVKSTHYYLTQEERSTFAADPETTLVAARDSVLSRETETWINGRLAEFEKFGKDGKPEIRKNYYYNFGETVFNRKSNSAVIKNHYIEVKSPNSSVIEETQWISDDSLPYSLKRIRLDEDFFPYQEITYILNFPYEGDTLVENVILRKKQGNTFYSEEMIFDTWREELKIKVKKQTDISGNVLSAEVSDKDGKRISKTKRVIGPGKNDLPAGYELIDETGKKRTILTEYSFSQ